MGGCFMSAYWSAMRLCLPAMCWGAVVLLHWIQRHCCVVCQDSSGPCLVTCCPVILLPVHPGRHLIHGLYCLPLRGPSSVSVHSSAAATSGAPSGRCAVLIARIVIGCAQLCCVGSGLLQQIHSVGHVMSAHKGTLRVQRCSSMVCCPVVIVDTVPARAVCSSGARVLPSRPVWQ